MTIYRWATGLLLVCVLGCGEKTVEQSLASAQQAVVQTVEDVGLKAVESSIELQLAGTFRAPQAFARLVSVGEGRPNIVQITTIGADGKETYPSIYLHGETTMASLDQLAKQSLPMQMFVQTHGGGPVWHSAETPVQVAIGDVQSSSLAATIENASLTQAETAETKPVSAKIAAERQ
jgi:hypothetical protein